MLMKKNKSQQLLVVIDGKPSHLDTSRGWQMANHSYPVLEVILPAAAALESASWSEGLSGNLVSATDSCGFPQDICSSCSYVISLHHLTFLVLKFRVGYTVSFLSSGISSISRKWRCKKSETSQRACLRNLKCAGTLVWNWNVSG